MQHLTSHCWREREKLAYHLFPSVSSLHKGCPLDSLLEVIIVAEDIAYDQLFENFMIISST